MIDHKYPSSFAIIENINNRNLVIWSYPCISEEVRNIVTEKCFSKNFAEEGLFFFMRKNNTWIYVKQFFCESKLALIVTAKDLSPTTYETFCDILIARYLKSKRPVDLVKIHLKLYTAGKIESQENGVKLIIDFKTNLNNQEVGRSTTNVKALVSAFKLQTILIYNALLLRKRILVYHTNIKELQESMMAMTSLTHRDGWQYVVPFIEQEERIKDFSFYLAGTLEEHLKNNKTLCDLFVNLRSGEIIANSKDLLEMTKFHKDLAHFVVQSVESDANEQTMVESVRSKTEDLLISLKSLGKGNEGVTAEEIKSRKFNANMEKFMISLARAENILSSA